MLIPRGKEKDGKCNGSVAVAVDKDKSSLNALKWATDTLLSKGQSIMLIHVRLKGSLYSFHSHSFQKVQPYDSEQDPQMKEFILPFKIFCTRKEIDCKDVILEDTDIAKALLEYVMRNSIENLVIGTPTRNGFLRKFRTNDVPGSIAKSAPDFCNVYIITKGKAPFIRTATRALPLQKQVQKHESSHNIALSIKGPQNTAMEHQNTNYEAGMITSPFTRGRAANGKLYGETSMPENDISFVGDATIDRTLTFPFFNENTDMGKMLPRVSSSSKVTDNSIFEPLQFGRKSIDVSSHHIGTTTFEPFSHENFNDIEAEMRKLQMELKQTKHMYTTVCKETDTSNQKAKELQLWKMEEEQKLKVALSAEEAAQEKAAKEKAKSRAAMERANAAKKIAEHESQKRVNAELKAARELEEKKKALNALANSEVKYRKYAIEDIEIATNYFAEGQKIGEGGYGPVYKCNLDHTEVAIKVLRPDATQGQSQFQQEVEVLSCIRHPNMVLLLGACPEYGCLVYEYMANGSLDDCLFQRQNSPSLPWQLRFRIASEISTGLLFLHQTKPEPLVHRDLKPGNILLDQNYVSKISDVGLARLVPPSVADAVTQYRMTSTAGTLCYIDPEYQQTGMLGIKSDIYSLGIMLLQLITAQPPMGLSHHVEGAIEKGTFSEMLDPSVPDWPFEEALNFASISLQCAELRRKDRPDLGKVVVPELNRLRVFAEENMNSSILGWEGEESPVHSTTNSAPDTSSPVISHFTNARSGTST